MDNKGRIRVLFVIGSLGCGGAERVALDVAQNINHDKFSIDFLIQEGADEFYRDEVMSAGCSIFHSPRFNPLTTPAYKKWMRWFIDNSDYDIVHFHQNTMVGSVHRILRSKGVKIVSHAHSGSFRGNKISRIVKRILVSGLVKNADVCIGCSNVAAECFYGKDYLNHRNCMVITNAIDVNRFVFNNKIRDSIRSQHGISGSEFVIGHVGSFTEPKNHIFLVNAFSEVLKQVGNARLLLIGDGPLKNSVTKHADELGCLDKITFIGKVKTPESYYCAMDVFVFPSLFEGLPLSVVEAQISGLYCVISDVITSEVVIEEDAVERLPLYDTTKWVDAIINLLSKGRRKVDIAKMASSRWGIKEFVGEIEEIYESLVAR